MLDIKDIRKDPQKVKSAMKSRNIDADKKIDELVFIDEQRRRLVMESESRKAEQNTVGRDLPALKSKGEDVSVIMSRLKELSDQISIYNSKLSDLELKQRDILLSIPNIPHQSVPIGKDESFNQEVRKVGVPREFSFEPKPHWEIGKLLNILDPERAAKVTGARFHFYKGSGAHLERSVINFYLDTHAANGYTEIFPPFMVNRDSMTGTGQLPKFEEDSFSLKDPDYFLIPTAEVPVTNMHRDEILDSKRFPLKYCAYSACFRAEAGSAGRDTRGLIRQHQFNKVELVKFSDPGTSYDELESLTNDAENVLKVLGIPYRVINLCTGDLGFASAKTYDIEVWMPSYNKYLEISSCSNMEAYQARRASIRCKDGVKDKARLVHTLNGSGLAVGRTVAAILENFQNEDGTVEVPQVLRRYMGTDVIR